MEPRGCLGGCRALMQMHKHAAGFKVGSNWRGVDGGVCCADVGGWERRGCRLRWGRYGAQGMGVCGRTCVMWCTQAVEAWLT